MYTNIFKPQRQYLFILRQLSLYQQRWIIGAAVLFGLMLIISLKNALLSPAGFYTHDNFNTLFFIGGIVLTSQIFKELDSPNRSYAFLSLPVSTLDKLIGSWLLSSPLYIIVFTLVSFAIYLLSTLLAGVSFSFAHFFSESYGNTITNYLVVQSIFFWGACYFRKNNLLKTFLFLIGLFFVLSIYIIVLVWALFGGAPAENFSPSTELQLFLGNNIETIVHVFFWALTPYMLLMSYYSLKEKQL